MNFSHLFTERDNTTLCPVRCVFGVGVAVYHFGLGWAVCKQNAPVDITLLGAYVQHLSTFVGIAGAAIGVKSALKGDAPESTS